MGGAGGRPLREAPRWTPTGHRHSGTPETPGVTEGMLGPPRQGCWPRMFGTTAGVLGAQGGGRSLLLPVVEC